MPACYAELNLKGDEIANLTPYEIEQRINGYMERMKRKRIFTASFITAPIINGGMRAPKKTITAKKLLPGDFREEISEEEFEKLAELVKTESKRRCSNGSKQ